MGSKVLNVCALWCYAVIIMINFNGTNGNELSNSDIFQAIVKLGESLDQMKKQITNMESKVNRCPESEGYFMAPGTGQSQCLKLILGPLTWTEARDKCRAEGLVLARPFNALALRKYIVERYGSIGESWINGRGNGSEMMWQENRDGDEKVGSDNPLWYPTQPGSSISSEHCLAMLTTTGWIKAHPDQPYYANLCSGPGPSTYHAVCEKLM